MAQSAAAAEILAAVPAPTLAAWAAATLPGASAAATGSGAVAVRWHRGQGNALVLVVMMVKMFIGTGVS